MKRKLLLSLLGFFIIILSNAQVKISEVYFDSNFDEGIGSNDHHYGEFIELYNRSNQSIDLSNWILKISLSLKVVNFHKWQLVCHGGSS